MFHCDSIPPLRVLFSDVLKETGWLGQYSNFVLSAFETDIFTARFLTTDSGHVSLQWYSAASHVSYLTSMVQRCQSRTKSHFNGTALSVTYQVSLQWYSAVSHVSRSPSIGMSASDQQHHNRQDACYLLPSKDQMISVRLRAGHCRLRHHVFTKLHIGHSAECPFKGLAHAATFAYCNPQYRACNNRRLPAANSQGLQAVCRAIGRISIPARKLQCCSQSQRGISYDPMTHSLSK